MNQNTQFQSLSDRVIREDECRKLTGVCRTTRYELEKKGISRHAVIWVVVQ